MAAAASTNPNSTSAQETALVEIEKSTGNAERTQWVLNAPEPPGLWRELKVSIKDTVMPLGTKFPVSVKSQPVSKPVVSVLQSVFPILCWCRNYKATKFKNDLLAGLTLASLCIPQVIMFNIHPSFT